MIVSELILSMERGFLGICVLLCTGSEEKLKVCGEYGADVAINYKTQDFATEVLSATSDRGNYSRSSCCLGYDGLKSIYVYESDDHCRLLKPLANITLYTNTLS